ncbi:MAG: GAF domain-containing protein [Chloroflexi bacterium]|nr:GAF domain-containing protein [Chloroflexota bacterium]
MNDSRKLIPDRIFLIGIFVLIPIGWLLTTTLPIGDDTRVAVLALAIVGAFYTASMTRRDLGNTSTDTVIAPLANTLIVTTAGLLLGHVMPMIVAFYFLSIAAVAIRTSLRVALWTAVLSTVGNGIVVLARGQTDWLADALILGGVFGFVALLIGMVADKAHQRTHALMRRHRELEAERVVARVVNQSLDLERVLNLALDQALQILGVSEGAIFLADEAQTRLTLTVVRGLFADLVAHVRPYAFGEGITGDAAAQRRVLIVTNVPADARVRAELLGVVPIHTQISVPLIARDCVMGVLNLSTQQTHRFSDDDVELLRAIGASVAVAIDHARWFATLEQRVAERTTELAALNRIAFAVTHSLDLDSILNAALDELTQALQIRGAWLSLVNPTQERLVLRAERGSTTTIHAHMLNLRMGDGLSGDALRDLQPHAVNLEESNARTRDMMLQAGYRVIAVVPLAIDQQAVGVLSLAGDQPNRFGESELRWLGAVGNTLAVAIKNARLFESVELQFKQLATLREIDHTLSSVIELTPLLETVLVRLAQVVPYDSAAVLLLDGPILRAVAARGSARAALHKSALDISDNAIFQQMVREQTPIIIGELALDARWVNVAGLELEQAWMGAPLIARGEVIGQIGMFSATARAFAREHSDLVMAFANHAAVAIANTRLREELREQARHDSLTGALNHGAFIEELRRVGERYAPLALIMLDLDNYKQYNDTYGHVAGDHVLTVTVQAIRAHIKQNDFVGRWGGEEFGIALPGANSTHAARVAERIRATLAQTEIANDDGERIPPPTVSQGIATVPETAHTVDELIDRADRALYRAKARGRDQVVMWSRD